MRERAIVTAYAVALFLTIAIALYSRPGNAQTTSDDTIELSTSASINGKHLTLAYARHMLTTCL